MSSVGTEYKVNIHMEPMGEIHLADCEVVAEFHTGTSRKHIITKQEMRKVDDDNYIAIVDSAMTGSGKLGVKLILGLPDADCDDGVRKEVQNLDTGIFIAL